MPRSDRSLTGAHEALKTTPKSVKLYKANPNRLMSLISYNLWWVVLVAVAASTYSIWWPYLRSWLGGV